MNIEPAPASDDCIGLIEARVLAVKNRFRAGLDIQAMPLPQRSRAQCRCDDCGDIAFPSDTRGEYVAVVETPDEQRGIEHPSTDAAAHRFVARLLPRPDRHVFRRRYTEVARER